MWREKKIKYKLPLYTLTLYTQDTDIAHCSCTLSTIIEWIFYRQWPIPLYLFGYALWLF